MVGRRYQCGGAVLYSMVKWHQQMQWTRIQWLRYPKSSPGIEEPRVGNLRGGNPNREPYEELSLIEQLT